MKAILALLPWLALSTSPLAELPDGEVLLLSERCLDDICIGDDESKVHEILKSKPYAKGFAEVDLNLEGYYSPAIRVYHRSSHFDIELYKGKVRRIRTYSAATKNKDGIGPGMTVRELLAAYTFVGIYDGEGFIVMKFKETPGWTYLLEYPDIPPEEESWDCVRMAGSVETGAAAGAGDQFPDGECLYLDLPILGILIFGIPGSYWR